jgi:tRNA/rRNA methyltransferase/tRNA (cytidine32/uridine32-2'-O)-methyltransferase
VVLDQPQDLVNIAHVVRAMKNFGLGELRLVSPREFDAYRIEGIAHRTGDILATATLYPSLDAALADCVHVVATTARGREARHNVQRPREAAAEILARAGDGRVALLFGREDKGLSNEALDRAHRVVTIPTSADYPSLNLGHAVAVLLYEMALATGAETVPLKAPRRRAPPATRTDLELLFADAERALERIGFFKARVRERIMRTLRTVVHRQPLDQREAKLLRAMAIEVVRHAERRPRLTSGARGD